MLTEIILETLKNFKWLTVNVIFNDYVNSYKNSRRYMRSGRPSDSREKIEADYKIKENQSFYNLLYQLQKQGFIEKKKDNNKQTILKLTQKGLKKLKFLKNKKLLSPVKPSSVNKKDYLKVIAFDIPENQRKKREWLRITLVNFNFSMLQKSVWLGDNQLPKDFFVSLKELNLLPYVHIFAVEKLGSISNAF